MGRQSPAHIRDYVRLAKLTLVRYLHIFIDCVIIILLYLQKLRMFLNNKTLISLFFLRSPPPHMNASFCTERCDVEARFDIMALHWKTAKLSCFCLWILLAPSLWYSHSLYTAWIVFFYKLSIFTGLRKDFFCIVRIFLVFWVNIAYLSDNDFPRYIFYYLTYKKVKNHEFIHFPKVQICECNDHD